MAKGAKAATKSEILRQIAEDTQLSRKQVASVFDALGTTIKGHLGKKGPGVFVVPGLCKMTVRTKPATKGGEKKVNSFTGQEYVTKPKPASRVVKIRALKNLKEMVK